MKVKKIIIVFAAIVLFGGAATQNVLAIDCTDPTFPGCADSTDTSTIVIPGTRCGAAGGTCGSADYCVGKIAIRGTSNDCYGGQYCCKPGDSYASNPNGSNIDPYAYEGANPTTPSASPGLNTTSTGGGSTVSGTSSNAAPMYTGLGDLLGGGGPGGNPGGGPGGTQAEPTIQGTGVYIPTNTGLPSPAGGIKDILENLLIWLLEIVGVIALIGFVIAGMQYILAAGNDDQLKTAKKNMTNAILGVVVALAGFVIIRAIDAALNASSMF